MRKENICIYIYIMKKLFEPTRDTAEPIIIFCLDNIVPILILGVKVIVPVENPSLSIYVCPPIVLKTEPPLFPVDFKTMTPSPPHLIDGIKPDILVEVVLIFTKSKVEVPPVPELAYKTNELAVFAVSI